MHIWTYNQGFWTCRYVFGITELVRTIFLGQRILILGLTVHGDANIAEYGHKIIFFGLTVFGHIFFGLNYIWTFK